MELSLEQKFSLRSFETQVKHMTQEQAQEFLVNLYEQMILRDNMYKEFIKHQWGLDSPPQHSSLPLESEGFNPH